MALAGRVVRLHLPGGAACCPMGIGVARMSQADDCAAQEVSCLRRRNICRPSPMMAEHGGATFEVREFISRYLVRINILSIQTGFLCRAVEVHPIAITKSTNVWDLGSMEEKKYIILVYCSQLCCHAAGFVV